MGNLPITIQLFNKKTLEQVEFFAASQLPFAVATALTKIVKLSQRQTRKGLLSDFTVRARERLLKGVRITPAKKADFKRGRIFADVYDIDEFLVVHATGGIRRAQGNKIAIPGEQLLKKGVRTASGKMKKKWRPQAEWFKSINRKPGRPRKWGRHKRPLPFAQRVDGKVIIGIRTSKKRKPVKWVYQFEPTVQINRAWRFVQDAQREILRIGPRMFIKQMNHAITTMR